MKKKEIIALCNSMGYNAAYSGTEKRWFINSINVPYRAKFEALADKLAERKIVFVYQYI